MLNERCIVWGPGAVMLRPNGEVSLDCECILVPKRIWSSWPLPPKRTSLAENYLRRLTVQGSQPFVQNHPNWNWKNELANYMAGAMHDWQEEQAANRQDCHKVASMWEILPPLTVQGPMQDGVATPYVYLMFLWEGYLHGPLRAHPMIKVRHLRKVLAELLETDLSGYSLNTISGPMSPDRPIGNFVWQASELLLLVKNSQGYAQPSFPNLGIGPKALCQGQIFVRHAKTDKNISTTSTVTFKSQLTVPELILKFRLGATHRWYLMYEGKLLKPDVLIPAHLRNRIIILVGTREGLGKIPASTGDGPVGETQGVDLEDADNEDILLQRTAEDDDLFAPNMAETPATQQAAGADLLTSLKLRDLAIVSAHAPRMPNDGSLLLPWRAKAPVEVPTYPAVPAEVLPDVTEGGAATKPTVDMKRAEINKAAFYMHECTDDITATTSIKVAPNITPVIAGPETSNRGEQLDVSTARAAVWPAAGSTRPGARNGRLSWY